MGRTFGGSASAAAAIARLSLSQEQKARQRLGLVCDCPGRKGAVVGRLEHRCPPILYRPKGAGPEAVLVWARYVPYTGGVDVVAPSAPRGMSDMSGRLFMQLYDRVPDGELTDGELQVEELRLRAWERWRSERG